MTVINSSFMTMKISLSFMPPHSIIDLSPCLLYALPQQSLVEMENLYLSVNKAYLQS